MTEPKPITGHVAELLRRRTARVSLFDGPGLDRTEAAARWASYEARLSREQEEHLRREKAEHEAYLRLRVPDELKNWGFSPQALDDLDAKDFDAKREHLVAAEQYLADQGPIWFVLLGTTSQGKTVAATYAARELMRRFGLRLRPNGVAVQDAVFVRAATLARLSLYDSQDRAFFELLCAVKLLVLDDLGTEHLADTTKAHLEELFDTRYAERLHTIITSNLDAAAFRARYGPRIAERIKQVSVISSGKGPSLRKKAGTK